MSEITIDTLKPHVPLRFPPFLKAFLIPSLIALHPSIRRMVFPVFYVLGVSIVFELVKVGTVRQKCLEKSPVRISAFHFERVVGTYGIPEAFPVA